MSDDEPAARLSLDPPFSAVRSHGIPPSVGRQAVAVFLGGSAGALARYWVGLWTTELAGIPLATLIANLSGSAVLGLLAGLTRRRGHRGIGWALLGVGFSGAFTTFSTFALEALIVLERQGVLWAALYVTVSVAGGLTAATLAQRRGLRW